MNNPTPARSKPSSLPSPLVFIVDDDPVVGKMLERSLQTANFRTALFEDPVAALASFQRSTPKPDLLITDYDMPDMKGAELICQCKAIHARLKTILLTGVVNTALASPLAVQPDIFITKPIGSGKLLEAIRGLLSPL